MVRRLSLVSSNDDDATNDAAFVAGVRAGDEQQLRALVNAYLPPLTRFAFGLIGDEDAAHDVVQDVFARVWRLGPDWDPRDNVPAYLFTAVRHRAFDVLKADRATERLRNSVRADAEATIVTDDPYVDVALAGALRREVADLTDRQREALRLRYEYGHSMSQVATILGIGQTAAEKLVSRALGILRDRLASLKK